MCLAVPGKIIAIKGDDATIDYGVQTRTAKLLEKNYIVGQYVIVQGGFVVQEVPEDQAQQALKAYAQAVDDTSSTNA